MRLSLGTGVVMLVGKSAAYFITHSSAIFSDAIESVIHLAAVAFAAFALWLSHRPADERFHYGYERISFFSAGWEGALITAAAVAIIVTAVYEWLQGLRLQSLGLGTLITLGLGLVNGALGWYLIHTGKRMRSLILEANGRHVLTDCWTSLGVLAGLCLVQLTGWKPFDPICAILMALNILWSGWQLIWKSARGLLDYADPAAEARLRGILDEQSAANAIEYHGLRLRETGGRFLAEVHLLFPYDSRLGRAHEIATRIETAVEQNFGQPVEMMTHLEAAEDHAEQHAHEHPR